MVDRDDDLALGIRTSAILFGRYDVAAVMACYGVFVAMLAGIGAWQHYGAFYYAGVMAAAAIALHHFQLIRGRTRLGCFRAFRHNNWIGLAVFAGIFADTFRLAPLAAGFTR
jgi:4-hydroxybenzoate polyprenyltransferase